MNGIPTKKKSGRTCVWAGIALITIVGCGFDISNFYSNSDDFLATGRTLSHFTAIQVDPRSEDSAGPQFVVPADLNQDGFIDLVSAWHQSQPIQIHLQQRDSRGNISFETVTLAGDIPVVTVAGLEIADFDRDGRPDIAVLVKNSLQEGAGCLTGELPEGGLPGVILIYYGPTDPAQSNQALAWEEIPVGVSLLLGAGDGTTLPENDGYTQMAVGDMDFDGDLDIVAAWNGACESSEVLLFENLGPLRIRDGTWAIQALPDIFTATIIKDLALADIDGDEDLDVIVTRPQAGSMNVHWMRNPIVDQIDDFHISNGEWQVGTIGQVDTGADIIRLGDIDQDGLTDVVMRSTNGALLQWFKGPEGPTTRPVRNIPWEVYTLAEFTNRQPHALSLGDVTGDGQLDAVVSAGGGLAFFNAASAPSVYDQWIENMIVDDDSNPNDPNAPPTTDPNVTPSEVPGTSVINDILIVDLDGDGSRDLVVTLDRSGLSGLTNDALVWFKNTR